MVIILPVNLLIILFDCAIYIKIQDGKYIGKNGYEWTKEPENGPFRFDCMHKIEKDLATFFFAKF